MKDPAFARRLLVWNEQLRDYYDQRRQATLSDLRKAARQAGFRWRVDYPEGRTKRWVWFQLEEPAPLHRYERRRR